MTIKQINHQPTGSISDTQTPQYRQTGRGLLACSDDVIQNISQFILKSPQDKHNLALVNKRFAKISESVPLPQGPQHVDTQRDQQPRFSGPMRQHMERTKPSVRELYHFLEEVLLVRQGYELPPRSNFSQEQWDMLGDIQDQRRPSG